MSMLFVSGKLDRVFALSACVFVGNSLIRHGKGHNVLEPAQAGCFVLHGRHMGESRVLLEWLHMFKESRGDVLTLDLDPDTPRFDPFCEVHGPEELGRAVAHVFGLSDQASVKCMISQR